MYSLFRRHINHNRLHAWRLLTQIQVANVVHLPRSPLPAILTDMGECGRATLEPRARMRLEGTFTAVRTAPVDDGPGQKSAASLPLGLQPHQDLDSSAHQVGQIQQALSRLRSALSHSIQCRPSPSLRTQEYSFATQGRRGLSLVHTADYHYSLSGYDFVKRHGYTNFASASGHQPGRLQTGLRALFWSMFARLRGDEVHSGLVIYGPGLCLHS